MAARTQTSDNGRFQVTSATASSVRASSLSSWAGYHIAIVSGTGAGQIRYAYTSGGEDRLRVSRQWDTTPDTSSYIRVAWNQDDYNSGWGNDFKLVLKAAAEWDVGADSVNIGNGTDAIVGGMVENAISLDEYWQINNNAYFAMGYLFGTPPDHSSLGGWYWNSNNANVTLGYQYIRCQAGGSLMLDGVNCGTVYAHTVFCQSSSYVTMYDCSFTNLMYNGFRLKGYTYGENLKLQGTGASNDYCVVASGIENFTGPLVISNAYGFYTSATDENITINQYKSVNAVQDIEAANSTTWTFVNPSWGTPIINWTQNDAQSQVYEVFTLKSESKTVDASIITSAVFAIIQGSAPYSATTPNCVITNGAGSADVDILTRHFVSTNQTNTYGNFVARIWHYGKDPAQYLLDVDGPIELPIGLADDTEIENGLASALAVTASVIHWGSTGSTGDLLVLGYKNESVALTEAAVVSGATSGAHGLVREDIEINTSSGYAVLVNVSGGPFTNNEDLVQSGTTKVAANSSAFSEEYAWEVKCNSNDLQDVYDYTMAKIAYATTNVEYWVSAQRQRSTQTFHALGGQYYTDTHNSEGVWLSEYGAGTVLYMTADDGTQFTPPSTVSFTLTGLQSGSEVQVLDATTRLPISGTESSGTSFTYNYVYGGSPTNVIVVVFHLNYLPVWLTGQSLGASDQSIPIQQTTDRVYANP